MVAPLVPRRIVIASFCFFSIRLALAAAAARGHTAGMSAPSSSPSTALVRVENHAPVPYRTPAAGRSWRRALGFVGLMIGGASIGIGVATGIMGPIAAVALTAGLAVSQTMMLLSRQTVLGRKIVEDIHKQKLVTALKTAEQCLVDSPAGALRTLAAANLASVLLQMGKVGEAIQVLDDYQPLAFYRLPLSHVIWLNNRAFAALQVGDQHTASTLLVEAQSILRHTQDSRLGGIANASKLKSAVAGTQALAHEQAGRYTEALQMLDEADAISQEPPTPFRTVERDLCRAFCLLALDERDEAALIALALREYPHTEPQQRRYDKLYKQLFPL